LSTRGVQVGIIGFGTVGTGTAKILLHNRDLIEQRLGFELSLKGIADLDIQRDRGLEVPAGCLTNRASDILDDPEIGVVVELIGGIHPAKELILEAVSKGKYVVTANKALLATQGDEVFEAAFNMGVAVGFEASVAGGIPIIKAVKESFVGNRISKIFGIMNGTANFILTKMTKEMVDFTVALKEAQRLGYAEADPTFDVEGIDTAHKLTLLASLAFGIPLCFDKIYIEGITRISPLDVVFASELGYKIKLLAVAKDTGQDGIELRVHPTMLPESSLIAEVDGVFNAVVVEGDAVGQTLFYGQGAGSLPTGSAVVSDIVDMARLIQAGHIKQMPSLGVSQGRDVKIKSIGDLVSPYYFRFSVFDKPGVLSIISGILGNHQISIESVLQKARKKNEPVPLVMLTHEASERNVVTALEEINNLSVVADKAVFIRVEDSEHS
jgi:homoserine dehydrogenase